MFGPNDPCLPQVVKIFGPPGCGKTETLSRIMRELVERHGPDHILIASFTKAAAYNIAARNPLIPDRAARTLHSHGYAALGGRNEIAETHIDEWNAENPTALLSPQKTDIDDPWGESRSGGGRQPEAATVDDLFQQYALFRARGIPLDDWPEVVIELHNLWSGWKRRKNYIDFQDMIEKPLRDKLPPPFEARFAIYDEAQDFTYLEMQLAWYWASFMEKAYFAGDDDQAVYFFKGADARNFIYPTAPPEQQIILRQSYRVPNAVRTYAQRWVKRVHDRVPKEYNARIGADGRPIHGLVRHWSAGDPVKKANWITPYPIVQDLQRYLDQKDDQGKPFSVMILATCSYMLEPTIRELKAAGLPYHNPYRRSRADWNPLASSQRGTSATDRLLAFLRLSPEVWGESAQMWTIRDLCLWLDIVLKTGVLKSGAGKQIERYKALVDEQDKERLQIPLDYTLLHQWFTEEALTAIISQDVDWFEEHLAKNYQQGMKYPLQMLRQHGGACLREVPRIIVGTMHSVKGGEAHVVYLYPDLSKSGGTAYHGHYEEADSIRRLFYVGMTRAADTLILCRHVGEGKGSLYAVEFPVPTLEEMTNAASKRQPA